MMKTKNSISRLSLLVVIILSVSGCKKSDESHGSGIMDVTWRLEYLVNTQNSSRLDFPADEPNKITIVFTDSLNTMLFSGICNSGSGVYTLSVKNDELTIKDIKTTLIHCRNIIWESYAVSNLENAESFSVNGDNLVIYTSGDYDLYFSGTRK